MSSLFEYQQKISDEINLLIRTRNLLHHKEVEKLRVYSEETDRKENNL